MKEKFQLLKNNSFKFQSMLKKFLIFRNKLEMYKFKKMNFQRSLKILKMRRDGDSLKEMIPMKKLLMPRSVLLKKG